MPAFYFSWREWKEDADLLKQYIGKYSEPDEAVASEEYKIHREVMFHDYISRKQLTLTYTSMQYDISLKVGWVVSALCILMQTG